MKEEKMTNTIHNDPYISTPSMSTSATIRPATPSDNEALSRICLLTGDAGSSAEASHSVPELLGLIYAIPYNLLDTTFGFVLVDTDACSSDIVNSPDNHQRVVGYILGTTDSRRFEEIAEREWWPALRNKYPKGNDTPKYRLVVYTDWHYTERFANAHIDRKEADERCISNIHSPSTTPEDITCRFPAHIHIDILPSHQVCILFNFMLWLFLTLKSRV